jgi:hypothetical protein
VSNPAPAPQEEHNSIPPNSTPQQKSQSSPPASRTRAGSGPMFALLLTGSLAENSINISNRSAR